MAVFRSLGVLAGFFGASLVACGGSTTPVASPEVSSTETTTVSTSDPVREAYLHEAARREADAVVLLPRFNLIWPTEEELDAFVQGHEAELRAAYEEASHRYRDLEPHIRARHILVRVARDASDEARAEARARVDALRRRIVRDGESFAEVAREASEDPGSAFRGGDLGWFPRGRMVLPFDEAAWALAEGEVSEPVETNFGFHLIVRLGRREGDVSFDDAAREIAESMLSGQLALARARADADTIAEAVRAGERLQDAVERVVDAEPMPRIRPWAGSRWQLPAHPAALRAAAERSFDLTEDAVIVVEADDGVAVLDVRVPPTAAGPSPEVRACLEERWGHSECEAPDAIGEPPCGFCVQGVEPSASTAGELTPELIEQLRERLESGGS